MQIFWWKLFVQIFHRILRSLPWTLRNIFHQINRYFLPKKCLKEAPIFYSEPHFMHGDPSLLEYAKGLQPNASLHATFITIEPSSGIPLSGSKKSQLSVKLLNSPTVEFLKNVTEGYFPIFWSEEVITIFYLQIRRNVETLSKYSLRQILFLLVIVRRCKSRKA